MVCGELDWWGGKGSDVRRDRVVGLEGGVVCGEIGWWSGRGSGVCKAKVVRTEGGVVGVWRNRVVGEEGEWCMER